MKKQSRSYLLVANWKMNPKSRKEAQALRRSYQALDKQYANITMYFAPPSAYLSLLGGRKGSTLHMGAQHFYPLDSGSYTGELSIPMLESVGASWVLIGHSERRKHFGLDDEMTSKQVEAAIAHEMPVVACIGEERRDEAGTYIDTLSKQLEAIMQPFMKNKKKLALLHIAYEPVWAIGEDSKRAVESDELFSTVLLIEKILCKYVSKNRAKKIPVLYGGSVDEHNIHSLASVPGIDGFLVGRAALSTKGYAALCEALSQ